jgi:hypothetical protein
MAGDANGAGPRTGDAPSEFARALSSACTLGSAILSGMAHQSEITRATAAFGPMIDPFRPANGAATDASTVRDGMEMIGFLGQIWMLAAASGLRYWRRLAQMYGEHQTLLLQALMSGGLSEDNRRTMIDELRIYVHNLGDVSLHEARVLHGELERLSHGLAAADGSGAADAQHHRRWRAKP